MLDDENLEEFDYGLSGSLTLKAVDEGKHLNILKPRVSPKKHDLSSIVNNQTIEPTPRTVAIPIPRELEPEPEEEIPETPAKVFVEVP